MEDQQQLNKQDFFGNSLLVSLFGKEIISFAQFLLYDLFYSTICQNYSVCCVLQA